MPTSTYEAIATYTIPSSTANYTFTSIPSTYTDLELVVVAKGTGAGDYIQMRLGNGSVDTGSNYSFIDIYASGTSGSMGSGAGSPIAFMYCHGFGAMMNSANTGPMFAKATIFDYANTTTHKKVLVKSAGVRDGSGYSHTGEMMLNSWRSTSAVNTLQVLAGSYSLAAGTTMTLYGIKAGS